MPIPKSLLNFLDKNKVKYEIVKHRVVYTALDKAATLKLKPQEVAKSVVVSLDVKYHMLSLIPASKNLDKKKLLALVNKQRQKTKLAPFKKIDFAKEQWMKKSLKGIKVGATPAFGIFYKLPTFIDNALIKPSKIIVSAGDYQNSLKIAPAVLSKLDPTLIKGSFSQKKK
ncbi:MAG: YbaK/EbsC family protein [bacterium]